MRKTAHPLLKRIGETVRTFRLRQGLSQEALAELAGIDRSYMSGIERGLRNMSVLHAVKLSAALQVKVQDLVQPRAPSFETAFDEAPEPQPSDSTPLADWTVGQYLSLG